MERDEAVAYIEFAELRWANNNGMPKCPRCDCGITYPMWTRCLYQCSKCYFRFSMTTGTIFASTKLPIAKIMDIIENKELNPHQLSKKVGITYKTAWVLCKKIKDAIEKFGGIFDAPVSENFKGYWQRTKKLS